MNCLKVAQFHSNPGQAIQQFSSRVRFYRWPSHPQFCPPYGHTSSATLASHTSTSRATASFNFLLDTTSLQLCSFPKVRALAALLRFTAMLRLMGTIFAVGGQKPTSLSVMSELDICSGNISILRATNPGINTHIIVRAIKVAWIFTGERWVRAEQHPIEVGHIARVCTERKASFVCIRALDRESCRRRRLCDDGRDKDEEQQTHFSCWDADCKGRFDENLYLWSLDGAHQCLLI